MQDNDRVQPERMVWACRKDLYEVSSYSARNETDILPSQSRPCQKRDDRQASKIYPAVCGRGGDRRCGS